VAGLISNFCKGLPTKKISNSQGSRGSNSRVESINWDNLIPGSPLKEMFAAMASFYFNLIVAS